MERLLTIKEFSEATGASRSTIWRWQRAGVIAGRKIGSHIVYTEQDIKKFIARHMPPAGAVSLDGGLNERVVRAIEIIAVAQLAQAVAHFGSGSKIMGFDIAHGLQRNATDLLRRLGIQQEQGGTAQPVIEGTRDQA